MRRIARKSGFLLLFFGFVVELSRFFSLFAAFWPNLGYIRQISTTKAQIFSIFARAPVPRPPVHLLHTSIISIILYHNEGDKMKEIILQNTKSVSHSRNCLSQ